MYSPEDTGAHHDILPPEIYDTLSQSALEHGIKDLNHLEALALAGLLSRTQPLSDEEFSMRFYIVTATSHEVATRPNNERYLALRGVLKGLEDNIDQARRRG